MSEGTARIDYDRLREKAIAVLSASLRPTSPAMLDALCELEREVYQPGEPVREIVEHADERIASVDDLIALCEAADQHLAYLRDGGLTTADQADALSATVDRVRAVIGVTE